MPWNPHLNPPNGRRPIGPARSILLVVTGGKSSDEAAVWEHGGADRCAAAADWIGAAAAKRIGRNQGRRRDVGESLQNKAAPGFPVPGRRAAGPFVGRRSRSAWKGRKKARADAIGCRLFGV